jgi:hypothetical protein
MLSSDTAIPRKSGTISAEQIGATSRGEFTALKRALELNLRVFNTLT